MSQNFKEQLIEECQLHNVILLHQSIQYGPNGRIAQRHLKENGQPISKEMLLREEGYYARSDQFDHIRYRREIQQPILSKIRAPLIFDGRTRQINQNGAQTQNQAETAEKDLARKKKEMYIKQIIQAHEIIHRQPQNAPEYYRENLMGKIVKSIEQDGLSRASQQYKNLEASQTANLFSKQFLRLAMAENLKKAAKYDKKQFKEKVQKISIFRDLNENYFQNKYALHMAQLSAYTTDGLLQKSTIQDELYVFINAQVKNSSTAGIIEFLLWKFIHKMAQSMEELILMSIVNGEEQLEIGNIKLNKDLKDDEKVTAAMEDQIVDMKEDVGNLTSGLYSVQNIVDVERNIRDVSEQGVMFYYGESPFSLQAGVAEERLYKPFLLQNAIIGLSTLQIRGNMVLKLHQAETPFTAGLLFILYILFESVLIHKPASVSPCSSKQFVVCKGLKSIAEAKEIKNRLLSVYQYYLDQIVIDPEFELINITDYMIIENEDRFRQSLSALNNANLSLRSDLIGFAVKCLEQPDLDGLLEVDEIRAWETKHEYLLKWDVPVLNLVRPTRYFNGPSNTEKPTKSALDGMNQEELEKNRQLAGSILDDLDNEEETKRKRMAKRRAFKARKDRDEQEKLERERPQREFEAFQLKVEAEKQAKIDKEKEKVQKAAQKKEAEKQRRAEEAKRIKLEREAETSPDNLQIRIPMEEQVGQKRPHSSIALKVENELTEQPTKKIKKEEEEPKAEPKTEPAKQADTVKPKMLKIDFATLARFQVKKTGD